MEGLVLVFGFAAGASAAFMTVARRFGFSAQGLQFVPGLDVLAVESELLFAIFLFNEDDHLMAERQQIDYLALALRRDHALVAFRQLLARFDVLLIFVNETASQTPAHTGDLGGR